MSMLPQEDARRLADSLGASNDAKQPQPVATGTEARVCADIAARQALGIKKYGTTVEDNPLTLRAWLQHAYEETLDHAIYLRRSIEQIDRELGSAAR